MKNKTLLIGTAMAAVFACNAYAAQEIEKCPGVKAIQSAGLSEMKRTKDDKGQEFWAGIRRGFFDTQQEWLFVVVPFNDASAGAAMRSALASLPTLHKALGPVEYETSNWACMYSDMKEGGIGAIAVTPPRDLFPNVYKFIRR